jgi:spore coat protein A
LPLRAACVAAAVALGSLSIARAAQEELDPASQPRFVNPLPNPLAPGFVFAPDGTHNGADLYSIGIYQFEQSLGLFDPSTGLPMTTTVWGYGREHATATYPGRTFVVWRDSPTYVLWRNELYDSLGAPLAHLLPIDETVHWAMPSTPPYPASGVPVVTHLHGGHTESASDGLPEQWFTPGFAQVGADWVHATFRYDNDQEAATLWYHDHALGITRLNVYAGLAGFYLLRDAWDTGLADNPIGLPAYPYEVPIVIQDRMFTSDGELFYPTEPEEPGAPEPSVLPEFFGDFILVNGQAWPSLEVEPREYRLRLLNGSDSRFYAMWLAPSGATTIGSGPSFAQIGTDAGLLYAPVPQAKLTLGPGERADVVVDFTAFAGERLVLRNNARSPFPLGDPVDPSSTGVLMAFDVTLPLDPSRPPTSLPATLRQDPIAPLAQTGPTRRLVLFEATDEYGRLKPMLGTADGGVLEWDDPVTELPQLGDNEVWEIFNLTPDAHPIHLHLVHFQIVDRQRFKARIDETTGAISAARKIGQPRGPAPEEAGWKDTVKMFPGQVTRVIASFDRAGLYVWHCHILSHEDHEMMRPFEVVGGP